jgi:hypothetical protein
MLDYEDMRDFQYGEENPGYRREVAYTPEFDPDRDPEVEELVAEKYAHDNRKRVENNLRAENAELRALLEEHGIESP